LIAPTPTLTYLPNLPTQIVRSVTNYDHLFRSVDLIQPDTLQPRDIRAIEAFRFHCDTTSAGDRILGEEGSVGHEKNLGYRHTADSPICFIPLKALRPYSPTDPAGDAHLTGGQTKSI
jgi:hypothetical protein